jgi:hypothetical protein
MIATCSVGKYSIPSEIGGKGAIQTGEQISVSDNWPEKKSVEITGLVVVFYDNGTEVGSVDAGAQNGGQNATNDLYPYPVYLTNSQSQTWTLEAGWQGTASSCTVVKVVSSPQVPQDQVGT